ncbi:SIMPL domain-containing protein [Pseudopontixanthobacter vadosimaris]|uniref:SIMPL domain-containing protein n=1 Tax=Pseudopontixanthobacter vadosimaris TaxID=2726450 RepID=UPI001F1129AE|nr:SIMPL domain-containing protein [Pseudopontixanthobacter vadosimaris]
MNIAPVAASKIWSNDYMMRYTSRFAAAIISAPICAAPAIAAEIQVAAQGPVVELSVTETVEAEPDIAQITAGVTTTAPTAVEAMRMNAERMNAVVARIKALGIAERDIQTTGINLSADYEYDQQTRQQIFRGYNASNRVQVKLRDVSRTGPVLDALVAAGANDIGGPSFSIDDDTQAQAQARQAAMRKAQAQAQDYARWAGYSGVRLLQVGENVRSGPPMPMASPAIMVTGSRRERTPVQPGLVGTSVTINVTYEMTR